MAFPLEREPESQNPNALHLLPTEDPRIVDSSVYPLDLTHNGWRVRVEKRPNGHADAVSYCLSRKIANGLNLDELGRKIGIIDEKGNKTNGYSLSAAPDANGTHMLDFTFNGVPTRDTKDVIVNLAKEFLPDYLKSKPIVVVVSSQTNDSGLRFPIPERLVFTTRKT